MSPTLNSPVLSLLNYRGEIIKEKRIYGKFNIRDIDKLYFESERKKLINSSMYITILSKV